jgi:hypothetical protein
MRPTVTRAVSPLRANSFAPTLGGVPALALGNRRMPLAGGETALQSLRLVAWRCPAHTCQRLFSCCALYWAIHDDAHGIPRCAGALQCCSRWLPHGDLLIHKDGVRRIYFLCVGQGRRAPGCVRACRAAGLCCWAVERALVHALSGRICSESTPSFHSTGRTVQGAWYRAHAVLIRFLATLPLESQPKHRDWGVARLQGEARAGGGCLSHRCGPEGGRVQVKGFTRLGLNPQGV